MKKITFLFTFLITAMSYGQELIKDQDFSEGVASPGDCANFIGPLTAPKSWWRCGLVNVTGSELEYPIDRGPNVRQRITLKADTYYEVSFDIRSDVDGIAGGRGFITSFRGLSNVEVSIVSCFNIGSPENLMLNFTVPSADFTTTPVTHKFGFYSSTDQDVIINLIRPKGDETKAAQLVYLSNVSMSAELTWTGANSSDWATAANWEPEVVPTAVYNVTIPTGTANNPIISATTGAVANNITTNDVLTIASGGSLIVGGTSTGNVTYKANVNDTNWHLLSSPVEGVSYDGSWIANNLIDVTTSTNNNIGIATYDNTTDSAGSWIYATDSNNTGTFNTAQGYSIKRDATDSDIAFTGTLKVDDASSIPITANDIGGAAENRWSLIGNPFPSYIKVSDLLSLTSNATALEDNREAVYISNGTTYEALTTGYIHPGQGFFVNSNLANTSIAINQDMLSHQTNVTFYKSATSNVSIVLKLTDGNVYKSTEVNYIADKTTGLDPGFDIGTFSASSDSFSIFSHLVSDNKGVHFMRQALPLDYENQIVPIGVSAKANKEITFSAESMNLPSGIKVFLEDRVHNTFTRLDEANAAYKITLTEALDGVGRFYIHTTQSALSIDNVTLTGVSVFKANAATLRLIGLTQGKASLSLFNVLGKQVMNTSFEATASKDISLPKLAKGIYFVKVQTATGELSKKIILE